MSVNCELIKINMLGEFSIIKGNKTLGDQENRSRKVWTLIEYLLANRNKTFSQEAIFEALWGDSENSSDPVNALKNLVYRARKVLSALSENDSVEFILYSRNTYLWNNSIGVEIDVELFEQLFAKALKLEDQNPKKAEYLLQAIQLYKGEFLPKSSHCDWVVSKSMYYMNTYIKSVLKASEIFMSQENYNKVIEICETALQLYPFEESIHRILLISLIKNKENNKALKRYSQITDMFYKELGVNVSDSIKQLYHEIIKNINHVETDITIINDSLQELYEENGAFYCEYEVFKNLYRVQARSIVRTGQSIQLALITLTDKNQQPPEAGVLKNAMQKLKKAILFSLRQGDTVANYSAIQFVVLLPLTSYENCNVIIKRIRENFKKLYKKNDIDINATIRSVAPTESSQ